MMQLLIAIALSLLQFAMGFGLVNKFKIRLKPSMQLSLSVLLGIAVFSMVPFLLQLFFVPLTASNIFLALGVICLLLNVKSKTRMQQLRQVLNETKLKISLYDIPFLLVIGFIVFVSVWRCFYFPPTSRDLTSGAEVIAEYVIREKTMINSVYSLHLETMNNHFKSPFIISLQVIYKYAGFAFGQIWLSNVFICFLIFLYHALSLKLHRFLAGLLLVCFVANPEMYAYSFMVLYDYSNAVFFFLAAYFLFERKLVFAGFLLAIATYVRSETLALGGMLAISILWHRYKFYKLVLLLLPSVLTYVVMVNIYINHYLPIKYDIEGLVNPHLFNLQPFFKRFIDINTELLFSKQGLNYYGYLFIIFLLVLGVDVFYKIQKTGWDWLFAILVVYFGMAILGFLLPLLDLDNSTKRGLFKLFPLMLLYLGNSTILQKLSKQLEFSYPKLL